MPAREALQATSIWGRERCTYLMQILRSTSLAAWFKPYSRRSQGIPRVGLAFSFTGTFLLGATGQKKNQFFWKIPVKYGIMIWDVLEILIFFPRSNKLKKKNTSFFLTPLVTVQTVLLINLRKLQVWSKMRFLHLSSYTLRFRYIDDDNVPSKLSVHMSRRNSFYLWFVGDLMSMLCVL